MTHKVISVLNNSITYKMKEKEEILFKEDDQLETNPFSITLRGVPVLLVVGNERNKYISKRVLHVPIYLVSDGGVVARIGVFEYLESEAEDVRDEDGDIDLDKVGNPLLFPFVTREYLMKYKYEDSDTEEDSSEEDDSSEDDSSEEDSEDEEESSEKTKSKTKEDASEETDSEDEEEESSEKKKPKKVITVKTDDTDTETEEESSEEETESSDSETEEDSSEETTSTSKSKTKEEDTSEETDSEEESEDSSDEEESSEEHIERKELNDDEIKYKLKREFDERNKRRIQFSEGDNWIQSHFQDGKYDIIENVGAGDCLFDAIRQSYESIGEKMTIQELRTILSKEVNEATFDTYRNVYVAALADKKEKTKDLKDIEKKYKKLKKEFKSTDKTTDVKVLMNEMKKKAEEHKELKRLLKLSNEFYNEMKFMEKIDNIDEFRDVLKTCRFWADAWAISTLERVLHIKLIILSKEAYDKQNYPNIIQCGMLNDDVLKDKGSFIPKHYIILEWIGYHYRLVKYDGKGIFQYEEIPFDIKELIFNKCMTSKEDVGAYIIIPDFKRESDIYHRTPFETMSDEPPKREERHSFKLRKKDEEIGELEEKVSLLNRKVESYRVKITSINKEVDKMKEIITTLKGKVTPSSE